MPLLLVLLLLAVVCTLLYNIYVLLMCICLVLQVREEAGELCQTLEEQEGPDRAASEMADLLYHAMVLLNVQVRALCQLANCCTCRLCLLVVSQAAAGLSWAGS